jgi:hypothetical protein
MRAPSVHRYRSQGHSMKKRFHVIRALRCLFMVSLAALFLLTGCGKLRGLYERLKPANPHSVAISWNPSNSSVAGYNVYRDSEFSGPVKLTPQIVAGTQFTDKNVQAGRTYSYYVTSVDFKGLESKPSDRISVTIPQR